MSNPTELKFANLSRRYALLEQAEWLKLLDHFDFVEGFAFVLLLVPDSEGAALCRRELEGHLESEGHTIHTVECRTPTDLRQLPEYFLQIPVNSSADCVWVEGVKPDYAPDYADWRQAWEITLARLNAFRNPIREHFPLTLIFIGAPWLQEVMREIAPDLWSVRSLVVRIEVKAPLERIGGPYRAERISSENAPDPFFALDQALRLRGVSGKELALANLLHRAGEGFAVNRNWQEAEKAFAEALELKDKHGAPTDSVLSTLIGLYRTFPALGRTKLAISLVEKALTLAHEIGDKRTEVLVLEDLAIAYMERGETLRAINYHERALIISRELEDRLLEESALNNLGVAYRKLGDGRRALECYQQARALSLIDGNKRMEGAIAGGLGLVYAELGETQLAIEYYKKALTITGEIGDKELEAANLCNIGIAYANLGEIHLALSYYERALIVLGEIGDLQYKGITLQNIGIAYMELGEMRHAIEYFERALTVGHALGDRRSESKTLQNLGHSYEKLGESRLAIESYVQAIAIAREVGDKETEGGLLCSIGNVYREAGEQRLALEFYGKSLEIAREIDDRLSEGITLSNMSLSLYKLADRPAAISTAQAALQNLEQIEHSGANQIRQRLEEWRQSDLQNI